MSIGNIVSVSGGKDSTATLLLAIEREAENLEAVFCDTGHEHQQTYDYVRELERRTGVPIRWVRADFKARMARKREFIAENWEADGVPAERVREALDILVPTGNPFFDLCLWKGRFHSTRARFCTQELKHAPIIEQVMFPARRRHELVLSWQGVRRQESRARANLPDFDIDADVPGVWNYRPILRWTVEQVFDQHRRHGIPWNPLYEQGMGRVGCMPCIHARKDELREIGRRFPDEVARVRRWEELVSRASKHGVSTLYDARRVTEAGESHYDHVNHREHGIDAAIEWSKTTRGGRQYDLIAVAEADDDAPQCSSIYGLCE